MATVNQLGAGVAVADAARQMADKTESGVRLLATMRFQIEDFGLVIAKTEI